MKYLYVLVSNSNDYYSEQCFISVYSLKQKTPNAFVALLMDSDTNNYLQKDFPQLLESVNEIKTVDVNTTSNKEKSRILKTSMRKYIDGDFLFIDCDTVICDDLSEIEKCEYNIGAVLDNHIQLNSHWQKKNIIQNYQKCGFVEVVKSDLHYNSGVIYCKDNAETHSFFSDWYSLWEKNKCNGVIIDQPSFNQASVLNNNIIKTLSDSWNCQILCGGIKYYRTAKIIHYFASFHSKHSLFTIDSSAVYDEIRHSKKVTNNIHNKLLNTSLLIEDNCTLISGIIPRGMILSINAHPKIYYYLYKLLHILNITKIFK